ncbi:MAG: SpoIIE family protein phosphatase [Clostridia bacterium]|nr:SpoIIE family protein phosphatase [Clostridia bacterium]
MQSGKSVIKQTFIYISLCLCLLLVRQSDYAYGLSYGLFVGCLYCLNIWLSSLIYIISSLFGGVNDILISLSQAVPMLLALFIHGKINKKVNRWLLIGYICLSQLFYVFYQYSQSALPTRLMDCAIALIYSFICIYVLRALFVRGLRYKMGVDEQICILLVVAILTKSLAPINIEGVYIVDIIVPFVVLTALFVFSPQTSGGLAVAFGLGIALQSGQVSAIAIYCLYVLFAYAFCSISRLLSALSLTFSCLITTFFFDAYARIGYWHILACAFGCLCFCAIPSKSIQKWIDIMGNRREQYSVSHIINRLRGNLSHRLYQLADVFHEMQLSFKSMATKQLEPQKACIAIAKQVSESICKDCPERAKCWRVNLDKTENAFIDLATVGLDRGKATLLDIPNILTTNCMRLNTILTCFNREIVTYKQYYQRTTSECNSKLLIGEQLDGVSRIMMQLSSSCKGKLVFDRDKEKRAMQDLTFYNCLVKEVSIWQDNDILLCSLTIASAHADKEIVTTILSKICNCQLYVDSAEVIPNNPNWKVLFLRPKSRYNVTYGYVGGIKHDSTVSGDTYSFIRLSNDKFLLALCDGMGSGEVAEHTSNTAISLVENFYKAGFDSDIILSCVNKLLATKDDEVFTAIDLCIIDLSNGNTDFIKLGAPNSVIKCGGEVQFIANGSLPLGVLEEMKPLVSKKVMGDTDIIVMYTDGFADMFSDKNEIGYMLTDINYTNPQIIAEELYEQAERKCNGCLADDTTIIVAKLSQSA